MRLEKKLKKSESPEEEVYILEIILLLFCSEDHYVYSKGNDTEDTLSHCCGKYTSSLQMW